MSELRDDPVLGPLTRFTPSGVKVDPIAIGFAAGRASARTPRGWKFAAVALLLVNLALVGAAQTWHRPGQTAAAPQPIVIPVVLPVPIAESHSAIPPGTAPRSPWRLAKLMRVTEVEQLPEPIISDEQRAAAAPLTPLSLQRANFD